MSGPVSAGYEALIAQGGNTVTIGAIAISGKAGNLTPVSLTVGGDTCDITVVPGSK